ncbi:MAG: 2-phospho-L-lactate guanylyltransferase, partial [bacterium]
AKDVLSVLVECPDIAGITICSNDAAVQQQLSIFNKVEVIAEPDSAEPGLNSAVGGAVKVLADRGVREILIMHADLPLLTSEELESLLTCHGENRSSVTIAPDRHGDGTNCLIINSALGFRFRYGPGSFQKHCAEAVSCGTDYQVVETPGTGTDVDYPEDLLHVINNAREGRAAHALAFIRESGIADRLSFMNSHAHKVV